MGGYASIPPHYLCIGSFLTSCKPGSPVLTYRETDIYLNTALKAELCIRPHIPLSLLLSRRSHERCKITTPIFDDRCRLTSVFLPVDPSPPQPKRTIVQRKWVQVFRYDKWHRFETWCLAFCCRLVARKFHEKWDTNDEARPHIKHIFYVKHLSPHAQTHLHQYSNYRWITLTSQLFTRARVINLLDSSASAHSDFLYPHEVALSGAVAAWEP